MWALASSYFKIFIFALLLLAAVQVPGFVDMYGKNLAARIDENNLNLSHFQQDADQYFGGDFIKLIARYRQNPDPIIQKGGANLAVILDRQLQLKTAYAAMHKSQFSAYKHVLLQPIKSIRSKVWQSYDFAVTFNKNTLIVGFSLAVASMLILEILFLILRLIFASKNKQRHSEIRAYKTH